MMTLARFLAIPLLCCATAAPAVPVESRETTAGAPQPVNFIEPSAVPLDPVVGDPALADRVLRALSLVGVPYRMGGSSPETGFDCSGLVAWVYRETVKYSLPRSADGLYRLSGSDRAQDIPHDQLVAGDLVFFSIGRLGGRIDHVGIATGDGRFLHAPSRGGVVRLDSLDLAYWKKHYAGARRLPVGLSVMMSPVKNDASLVVENDATP